MQVSGRLRLLMIVFAAAFAAVEARLVHLQFRTREFWQKEALEARTDVRMVNAARGDLLDCWGRPLAVSRPQHTLSFSYGPFRQNTPIGQIRAASRILEYLPAYRGGSLSVAGILASPIEWARFVLERSDAELAELPPQMRRDYGFYVRRLLALSESQYTKAKSERGGPNLPYFTITGEDREIVLARIVDAVSAQRAALAELARTAEQTEDVLLTRVDEVIAKLEGEVQRAMEIGGIQPGAKQEALIRRDLEYRARELFRDVEFSAVFAVNLAPDVYAGFEVHDEERRFYPPETEDICPILIGKVNDPPEFLVKQTEERRARLLQLQSLPPEQMDQDTVLEIDRLRSMIRETDYLPDEEMGGLGLEALLESQLRGKRGWRYVETDSSGQDQTLLSSEPPLRGANVRITLDSRLQAAAERVLAKKNWPGAIVLLDPTDGGIRAMATWPCPTRKQLREDYAELTKDPRAPLFHRGYQSPKNPPAPGSVFKIVTTAAALESHTIGPGHVYDCERSITRGRTTLSCLFHHGPLPLDTAFQKSCNVYYYKLGEAVGLERIVEMARTTRHWGARPASGTPSSSNLPEPSGEPPRDRLRRSSCRRTERKSITNAMRSAIGQSDVRRHHAAPDRRR
jgi:cell division protein FtsI/penicillin-binding protein 2